MPKNLSTLAIKGTAGFLIGLAVWYGLAIPYARLLASVSEFVIQAAERPAITSITPMGSLLAVDRSDLRNSASEQRFAVETMDITFNVILLMTLFAMSARPLSDRNVFGFLGAATALFLVHAAAVVSFVEANYALNFGVWSAAHYGFVARHFWTVAPYFYSVIGVHGCAFALWWLFRVPSSSPSAGPGRQSPKQAPRHSTASVRLRRRRTGGRRASMRVCWRRLVVPRLTGGLRTRIRNQPQPPLSQAE